MRDFLVRFTVAEVILLAVGLVLAYVVDAGVEGYVSFAIGATLGALVLTATGRGGDRR